jgi:hypothetical protein
MNFHWCFPDVYIRSFFINDGVKHKGLAIYNHAMRFAGSRYAGTVQE